MKYGYLQSYGRILHEALKTELASISASIMCALGYDFTGLNLTSLFVKGRWRMASSTSCRAVHLPPPSNHTPQDGYRYSFLLEGKLKFRKGDLPKVTLRERGEARTRVLVFLAPKSAKKNFFFILMVPLANFPACL